MKRSRGILAFLAAATAVAAGYGGWATITVENLPDNLVAGQPYNLTFSIRQHGVELFTDLTPYVELKNGQTELTARAVETNRPGYYTATLNVPKSGDWAATIQTSFGKSRLKLMPIAALDPGSRRMVSFTAQQRGERLFVAKGCMSCHEHAQVPESGEYKVGPVLTKRRFEQGYLRRFLADPSIKPPTVDARMPNLGLSEADIASLVAFLNGDPDMRAASGGF